MGLDPQGYGNPDFCWLSLRDTLIWSFAGPIGTVIIVSTGWEGSQNPRFSGIWELECPRSIGGRGCSGPAGSPAPLSGQQGREGITPMMRPHPQTHGFWVSVPRPLWDGSASSHQEGPVQAGWRVGPEAFSSQPRLPETG